MGFVVRLMGFEFWGGWFGFVGCLMIVVGF